MKALALGLGLAVAAVAARADHYPQRPITMVVPFAAGGPTDVIARIVADPMSKALGEPVVIENVVGAGGTTGITRAAQAAPDGYTIMMGHMGTHGAAPALFEGLGYDPARSFDPIGLAAGTPIVVVARKDFAPADLKGLIETLRADGPAIRQAHAGIGSVSHAAGILFDAVADAKPTLVAYGGTGPALSELMAGRVDVMTDQIVNVAPQIRGGTIRAYAVATHERSPALPEVPTAREAGLYDYEVSAWNAVFAPKGLPRDVRMRLEGALAAALRDEGVKARILERGGTVPTRKEQGPGALQSLVEGEVARWTPVLRAAVAGTR